MQDASADDDGAIAAVTLLLLYRCHCHCLYWMLLLPLLFYVNCVRTDFYIGRSVHNGKQPILYDFICICVLDRMYSLIVRMQYAQDMLIRNCAYNLIHQHDDGGWP